MINIRIGNQRYEVRMERCSTKGQQIWSVSTTRGVWLNSFRCSENCSMKTWKLKVHNAVRHPHKDSGPINR